jgi:hypothetical protein
MTVKPHTIKIVGPAPTPDIAGLCERLRNRNDHTFYGPKTGRLFNPDGPEAANTLERQAAEIERLRGALAEIPKTAKTLRIATSALVLAGKSEAAEMVTSVADGFEAIAHTALTGEDT